LNDSIDALQRLKARIQEGASQETPAPSNNTLTTPFTAPVPPPYGIDKAVIETLAVFPAALTHAATVCLLAPQLAVPGRKAIAKAKIAAKVNSKTDRSAAFQSAINTAARAAKTKDEVETEMRAHPDGPQQKYLEGKDRLRPEINRSWSTSRKLGAATCRRSLPPKSALQTLLRYRKVPRGGDRLMSAFGGKADMD